MMAAHRDGVGMIPVGVIGRVWKTVFFRNGVIHRGAIQSRVRCSFMPVSRTLPLVAIFRLALPVLTRMGMNRRLGMPLALLAAGTQDAPPLTGAGKLLDLQQCDQQQVE